MDRKRLIFSVVLLMIVICIPQVAAADWIEYSDTNPDEIYGSWDATNNEATEGADGLTYRLILIFECNNIPQNGDDYKVEIDFDSMDPSGHAGEKIHFHYRWGNDGSWTYLDYGFGSVHKVYDISNASSSTFQIKFEDDYQQWFESQHTWTFGNEPILRVY